MFLKFSAIAEIYLDEDFHRLNLGGLDRLKKNENSKQVTFTHLDQIKTTPFWYT